MPCSSIDIRQQIVPVAEYVTADLAATNKIPESLSFFPTRHPSLALGHAVRRKSSSFPQTPDQRVCLLRTAGEKRIQKFRQILATTDEVLNLEQAA
ncbi:hypothetical protein ACFU7D_24240 [Nocardioides sp. NPDC057577]|uniref:hypothetical protein n=1 Tax=Nocardioides sp. NPDC057577 TaxID=3346171 RepID=UPI00367009FD